MPDIDWIRHLARASFAKGQWNPEDPEEVRRLAAGRIDECITALYEEARETAEIFNAHARGNKAVRLLPIAPRPGESAGGIMLLLGTTEIDLEYGVKGAHTLEATLKVMRGYQRKSRRILTLRPHVDPFGSVLWQADKTLLMTPELIMKTLFEQLARAAYEAGEIIDKQANVADDFADSEGT